MLVEHSTIWRILHSRVRTILCSCSAKKEGGLLPAFSDIPITKGDFFLSYPSDFQCKTNTTFVLQSIFISTLNIFSEITWTPLSCSLHILPWCWLYGLEPWVLIILHIHLTHNHVNHVCLLEMYHTEFKK